MNSQVCVICYNKKTVNQTDNRLVTESCGHVKCMNCLLQEKSGCLACLRNDTESEISPIEREYEPIKTFEMPTQTDEVSIENQIELEDLSNKRKSDNSHIKVEIGMYINYW